MRNSSVYPLVFYPQKKLELVRKKGLISVSTSPFLYKARGRYMQTKSILPLQKYVKNAITACLRVNNIFQQ